MGKYTEGFQGVAIVNMTFDVFYVSTLKWLLLSSVWYVAKKLAVQGQSLLCSFLWAESDLRLFFLDFNMSTIGLSYYAMWLFCNTLVNTEVTENLLLAKGRENDVVPWQRQIRICELLYYLYHERFAMKRGFVKSKKTCHLLTFFV